MTVKEALRIRSNDLFVEIKDERKKTIEKLIYALLLGICVFGYYAIYINKAFPVAEGWHSYYAELIKAGNVPYRDFFYYLPPLNLVIDFAIWTLSFGSMLVFRLWRLAERIAMLQVMYFTLCRYYNSKIVFLGCLFAGIIAGGSPYDLGGDYNQTAEFLTILTCVFALRFAEEQNPKSKYKKMALAGCMLGLTFLCKQSMGGISMALYAFFLCAWCFFNRDKKILKYALAAVIGILAPIAFAAIVLACFGALRPAVEQIFLGANSKGGLYSLLFESISLCYKALIERFLWIIVAVAVLIVFNVAIKMIFTRYPKSWSDSVRNLLRQLIKAISVLVAIALFVSREKENRTAFYSSLEGSELFTPLGILALIFVLVGIVCLLLIKSERIRCWISHLITVAPVTLLIVGFFLVLADQQREAAILAVSQLFDFRLFFLQAIVLVVTGVLAVGMLVCIIRRKQVLPSHVLVFSLGSFASMYASFMTSSGSVSDLTLRMFNISLPFAFCYLLSLIKSWKVVGYVALTGCCVVSCLFTLSSKAQRPYEWWGYIEDRVCDKTEAVDIPGLEGYRFSPKEKNFYEQIYRLVEENTDEDDVVFGFPYVKIFNQLTGHIQEAGFVPVHFFDVCPDGYASEDAKRLAQNPPDLIIWQDMGGYCWTLHEELFRNGERMGQRDIQEWFVSSRDQYEVVGQIHDLFIYKRKDNGTPVGYTYFQHGNGDYGNVTIRPENRWPVE